MTRNTRFKIARITSGLTQRALGQIVGVPEYWITRIETGRANPDTDLRKRLAAVLKKPGFELFAE
jgi:DNA-binding XRE family transcriptional regulator